MVIRFIYKDYKNQRAASLIEYALVLALVIGVFILANQLILNAVDQRTQVINRSFENMPGCSADSDGSYLRALNDDEVCR